jgi:GNAT superfamily N-acetyltransferase
MNAHVQVQRVDRTLKLRLYTAADVDRVADLIVKAIPQMPNYRMIKPDRQKIVNILRSNNVGGVAFACWVLCDLHNEVQGGVAGWCVQNILSSDLVADDIFMWVEPDYRSINAVTQMIRTYVEWAKSHGAKLIRASHTGGSWPKSSREYKLFDALLQRNGFKEVGSVYHLSMYGE